MINNEPTKQDECRWCRGLCCGDWPGVADEAPICNHWCRCGDDEHRDTPEYDRDEVQS
jgi:hypothetical protein